MGGGRPPRRGGGGWVTQLVGALVGCEATTVVKDVAIAVVTSSPVHEARLPALAQSWLVSARETCAGVVVVSDVAVSCADSRDPWCVATVACPCSASHWGLACKTACAFVEARKAAPTAAWYARVMDDTVVSPTNLALHLQGFDPNMPWYVGEMVELVSSDDAWAGFEAALGGAGWALSRAATDLAISHMDAYHELTWSMGCNYTAQGQVCAGPEWPVTDPTLNDAARGLKLRSPIADDVMWGAFMAALRVPARGPAGFSQAPVDVLDGIPLCAETDDETEPCARRPHDVGVLYSDSADGAVAAVKGLGACRDPRFHLAVVHMGDEVGSMPSAAWRAQIPHVADALSSGGSLKAIYHQIHHYWRLCALDAADVRPPLSSSHDGPPPPVDLKLSLDGAAETVLSVSPCDRPSALAADFCATHQADTDSCRDAIARLARQATDLARRHPRPLKLPVELADGSAQVVRFSFDDDPTLVASDRCRAWRLAPADCDRLAAALTNLLPDWWTRWCRT